ncbi:MAG TPA: hypothetical protein VN962_15905 [Polyangia bacterium]|nr:hypothetical protein [Polyangia bacterium]
MKQLDRTPHPELDPLWQSAKALDDVPDAARERALLRARAIVAAAPRPVSARPAPRLRLALAAAGVLALGTTAALAGWLSSRSPVTPAALPNEDSVAVREEPAPQAAPRPEPLEPAPAPRGRPPHRRASLRGELELIQGAQASYADGDLPAALQLLAEHARWFPNGRLAEEREALRVRSLARSGRDAEAQAALHAFATRFPHSMLLPHLREALGRSAPRP